MAIAAHDDHQQRAELRTAFLKHLPKRIDQLVRRGRRFCVEGWDINGLSLLQEDVQRIAGTAGRYGAIDISQQLLLVEHLLDEFLRSETLPDQAANERLLQAFEELADEPVASTAAPAATAPPRDSSRDQEPHLGRAETPPSHYWRRWTIDAPPPTAIDSAANDDACAVPLRQPEPEPAAPASALPAAVTAAAAAPIAPARPAAAPGPAAASAPPRSSRGPARIYHLFDGSDLALELDQKLETLGHEIEILEDGDELKEVLNALAPDLVIVDAGFVHELESIGAVLRSTRERAGSRLPLLAISDEDSVPVRLAARRAGADALLVQPRSVADVLARIDELLESDNDATYRVLIVEDDRSQGLFAESILRNAGMQARVVDDAFEVLSAMEQFRPDLVLMDLYMPECDGTELTALIRERDEFLHTPIVFLSGESDLDKHYQALDAGGDDFLSKPIRPKHLISAVSNRVRRSRAMQKRVGQRDPKDAATGLYARSYALDRINEILAEDDVRSRPGGVLFLDLDGVPALREKLGLSGVEQLLSEAGSLIARQVSGNEFAARYGDGCFIVISPDRPDSALEALAAELRSTLISHPFSVGGKPLRLRLAVGICAFRLGVADAGALLNTAERTSREARAVERGVLRFEPPQHAEDEQARALVGLIRNAIERDGFELLYQPIVAVQGGEESQYQTLLRLRDDAGQLHTASAIIPIAEHADLMLDVDRWVLGQALRTIETRRAQGAPVRLFVNQACSSLAAPDHADWLLAQLRARRIDGQSLVIELTFEKTEGAIEAELAFCQALMPAGVQFCLSRFEAGTDGDSVLEQLPVGFIKLAPRYLGAVQTQSLRDELRVLIDRAHRRGLLVIAQRVEDAQSAATLWMSGIDFIQGNLVQQAGRDLAFDFHAAVL
jgi:diguanylate cyclase (GGDEF)-like protein